LIRKNNSEGAIQFLQQLAKLIRLSLENARESFVPLKSELAALESYLSLQKTLFENQFDYSIQIEGVKNEEGVLIPPMLIQPFTENAILHGLAGEKEKGEINIRISRNKNSLRCIIEDNGRGFQEAEKNKFSRSLSTVINQERLVILGKQTRSKADLKIINKQESKNGRGVRVELLIPFMERT